MFYISENKDLTKMIRKLL